MALGTMTFGTTRWGADNAAARMIFETFVEAGGNFIDTADIYSSGRSEEMLGSYIAERSLRDRLVLVPNSPGTKIRAIPTAGATVARTSIVRSTRRSSG